jgi:8-oxo-dGTP pyrophosphatase MutT (NUDIX family)
MIITVPVVFVLLEQPNGACLLLQRAYGLHNDRFDGVFSLPGGKVDPHETLREAARREVFEEIGVKISLEDLEFMHVGNHFAHEAKKIIGVIFRVRSWQEEPVNREPERHIAMEWFMPSAFPENVCPFVKAATSGALFSEQLVVISHRSQNNERSFI